MATEQEPTYLYEMMLAPNSDVLEKVSGAVGARSLKDAEALFNNAGVSLERETTRRLGFIRSGVQSQACCGQHAY